jgi:ketopantoate reductase
MLSDLEAGRRTEVEFLGGWVAGEGLRLGVPVPASQGLASSVRQAEAAKRAANAAGWTERG